MSISIFYANYTSTSEISSNAQRHVGSHGDDLYVIEVLVAELDVVGGDVVDVVVDGEMELVVGVMAFVYNSYRMIWFWTLLWICKICIFISSTVSIRPLKYTVNTYIYYTYTHKIEWVFCLYLCKKPLPVLTALLHDERSLDSPSLRIGNQCVVTAQIGISFNTIDYNIPQSTVLPILLCNDKPSFYVSNLYSWSWRHC